MVKLSFEIDTCSIRSAIELTTSIILALFANVSSTAINPTVGHENRAFVISTANVIHGPIYSTIRRCLDWCRSGKKMKYDLPHPLRLFNKNPVILLNLLDNPSENT